MRHRGRPYRDDRVRIAGLGVPKGALYILDGTTPVPVPDADVLDWVSWMADFSHRCVVCTWIGGVYVSTVFRGVAGGIGRQAPLHAALMPPGGHPPADRSMLFFETMLFVDDETALVDEDGRSLDRRQWRYATWDDAVQGHHDALGLVQRALRDSLVRKEQP